MRSPSMDHGRTHEGPQAVYSTLTSSLPAVSIESSGIPVGEREARHREVLTGREDRVVDRHIAATARRRHRSLDVAGRGAAVMDAGMCRCAGIVGRTVLPGTGKCL